MESKPAFSIVVALRNERAALPELYQRIKAAMEPILGDWELVLVDDGSQDQTTEVIAFLCAQDPRARGISLTRNFGFQIAITAGLDAARGCAVILMNPDRQDPPEAIPEMIHQWRAGFDVVYCRRVEREAQNRFQRAVADGLNRMLQRVARDGLPLDAPGEIGGDFRLLDRRVVDAVKHMPEQHRSVRGMVSWIGFKQTSVACACQAPSAGAQPRAQKLLPTAIDTLIDFSRFPLRLAAYFGFGAVALGGLATAMAIGLGLLDANPLWAGHWITLAVVLFIGGVQLICIGIAGEYLGRMYDELKRRPLYLVDQSWGFTEQGFDTASRNPCRPSGANAAGLNGNHPSQRELQLSFRDHRGAC